MTCDHPAAGAIGHAEPWRATARERMHAVALLDYAACGEANRADFWRSRSDADAASLADELATAYRAVAQDLRRRWEMLRDDLLAMATDLDSRLAATEWLWGQQVASIRSGRTRMLLITIRERLRELAEDAERIETGGPVVLAAVTMQPPPYPRLAFSRERGA